MFFFAFDAFLGLAFFSISSICILFHLIFFIQFSLSIFYCSIHVFYIFLDYYIFTILSHTILLHLIFLSNFGPHSLDNLFFLILFLVYFVFPFNP